MVALEIDVPHHPDHLRVHEWKADFQSESSQTSGDVCQYRHLLCFCGDDLPGSGKTSLNSPPLLQRDTRVLEGGRPKSIERPRLVLNQSSI